MIEKVYDGKQVNEELECNIQTIKEHSNVDKLCPSTETKTNYITIIDRQKQVAESTQILDDSSNCLILETNLQVQAEELEAFHFKQVQKRISLFSHRSFEKALCHPFTNDLFLITEHFNLNDKSFTFVRMENYVSSYNDLKYFDFKRLKEENGLP
jgi:hypothetical protein